MVYKLLDEKSKGSGVATLSNIGLEISKQLAEELYKPTIRKWKKKKEQFIVDSKTIFGVLI